MWDHLCAHMCSMCSRLYSSASCHHTNQVLTVLSTLCAHSHTFCAHSHTCPPVCAHAPMHTHMRYVLTHLIYAHVDSSHMCSLICAHSYVLTEKSWGCWYLPPGWVNLRPSCPYRRLPSWTFVLTTTCEYVSCIVLCSCAHVLMLLLVFISMCSCPCSHVSYNTICMCSRMYVLT